MQRAIEQANLALSINEVPIGCVIVLNDEIIGYGHNTRETTNSVLGHAEINAIKMAELNLGTWKLDNCIMYVSVEPCIMCYGAIIQSRIKKVFVGSVQDSIKQSSYKKYITSDNLINESLVNSESKALMQNFFKKLREEK